MSLRNWCIKYSTSKVIEKLNAVSGDVKKSNKKLDYIQPVLVAEFEKPEEKTRDMDDVRRRMAKIGKIP